MGYVNNHNNRAWVHNDLIAAIFGHEEYLAVYNRDEIENKSDIVLISIHDPAYNAPVDIDTTFRHHPPSKVGGFHDVLQISFWDTEDNFNPKHPPLTKEHGTRIREFIIKNKDKQFLIHCAAGVSRSAGVGCAVECLVNYGGDSYEYQTSSSDIKAHYRYSPNLVVYDKIVSF